MGPSYSFLIGLFFQSMTSLSGQGWAVKHTRVVMQLKKIHLCLKKNFAFKKKNSKGFFFKYSFKRDYKLTVA